MEETKKEPKEPGENQPLSRLRASEAAALDIIRTETVLSRLPVHNLAKKGSINISIMKKTDTGEIELLWRVSPSRDYGEPRQLAYKLDTIVINQRIDEAGRPLPKLLRLGSLNEICTELGIARLGGKNKNELKKAFFQNVGALITAKFSYRANDGGERRLEAAFTRYSVIFTGEKLPDGRKADAVYVIFNEPFWEVLNNAPVRPLDRAYMKTLPPGAQRFYEIVSRKIFAALKNDYPRAKIAYSEYCTFSAQLRHFERQRVQDQMAKVLRPHKVSGYIAAVRYEATIDAENKPDWILQLTPGPRAVEEFDIAHGKRRRVTKPILDPSAGELERKERVQRTTGTQEILTPAAFDPQLLAHFTTRGITEPVARDLIANRKPNQDFIAQLEMADEDIKNSKTPIRNPAAYRVSLVRRNISTDGFETSAKRKEREDREREERARRAAQDAHDELEDEYELYCNREVDRYIEVHQAEFETIKEAKAKEDQERFGHSWLNSISTTSTWAARIEIRKAVTLPTFEEFVAGKREGIPFSLKPVAVPPAAERLADGEPTRGNELLEGSPGDEQARSSNTPSNPPPAGPMMAVQPEAPDGTHESGMPPLASHEMKAERPTTPSPPTPGSALLILDLRPEDPPATD